MSTICSGVCLLFFIGHSSPEYLHSSWYRNWGSCHPGDTTPLHFAASYNPDPAVIAVLLRAGADLNAREWLGRTPLHEAAWLNDNPAVITALVAVGADVNTRDDSGMTPLHTATQENFLSTVIEALLNAGADPSARGSEGRTPWALA